MAPPAVLRNWLSAGLAANNCRIPPTCCVPTPPRYAPDRACCRSAQWRPTETPGAAHSNVPIKTIFVAIFLELARHCRTLRDTCTNHQRCRVSSLPAAACRCLPPSVATVRLILTGRRRCYRRKAINCAPSIAGPNRCSAPASLR